MAVTLVGTGGLYKRLGALAGGVANVVSLQGGTATTDVAAGASMTTRGTTLESYWAESPALSVYLDTHWQTISSWRSAQSSLFQGFKRLAENVLIEQVHLDNPLPTKTVDTAMRELIRQMRAAATDINASSISAGSQTASTPTPTGTTKLVISLKNEEGYKYQTSFAETIKFTCTSDAQTGGATARNESFAARGKAAVSDVSNYLYSASGSGCNKTFTVTDSQSNNTRNNLLYNSGFDSFNSTNYPGSWVIATGAVTTNVLAAGSGYTGGNALRILGDAGGTLTKVTQAFDTTANTTTAGSGGTPAELEPLTVYHVSLFVKRDNALSAGNIRVSLTDGSGTVTTNVAGDNNEFDIDATALTASYVHYSGAFQTPAVIPSTGFKLAIALTTAIDDADSVFIDDVSMCEATQLYNGGPWVSAHAGDTNPVLNDAWTVAISATWGVMAMWMERFFALREKGLIIPYDEGAAETVADSLVA